MGEFANGLASKIFAISLSVVVILVNIYFVFQYVLALQITAWYSLIFLTIFGACYLLFCLYLTIDMAIHMGADGILTSRIGRYFPQPEQAYLLHDDSEE